MSTARTDGASEARPGALSALNLAFEVVGRLVSVAVLAFAILSGRGEPLLFLWGLWLEEALSLTGLCIRQAIVRRHAGTREPRGTALGMFFFFAAVHALFVIFFSFIGATGLFAGLATSRLAVPSTRSVLVVAGTLVFWTVVDVARAALRRRSAAWQPEELARIDREARLAIFLPHVTIIAGGLCLVVFRLGGWMSWGILAGKVLFEALSFALARGPAPAAPA